MKKIIYKVPGGKLLRLQYETSGDTIKEIKITGDFFIHPETAIMDIENFLVGKKIGTIDKSLSAYLLENNISIIGFKPEDIYKVIIDNYSA